ncbi:hypothetical protein ACHAWF_006209 [Thalassiosira exigua]
MTSTRQLVKSTAPEDTRALRPKSKCILLVPVLLLSLCFPSYFFTSVSMDIPASMKATLDSGSASSQNKQQQPTTHSMENDNVNITEADLFKSACIWYDSSKRNHRISYASVFGSWDFRTSNRSSDESINSGTRYPAFVLLSGPNVTTMAQPFTRNIMPPIMYVPPIPNPAHCVQDMLFSLLPMAYRGDLHGVHAVTVNRPEDDYCVQAISALAWFDDYQTVSDNTCFEKLWVPAFMHYRFPRGRSRGIKFVNGNGYLHNEDLPREMMHFFRQEMWRAAGLEKRQNDSGILLFESRRGTGRRMWKNVDEIAERVRRELGTQPGDLRIVDNVGMLSWKDQAELYSSASVIVTPHSGSNPNIIFMRPNSTVFEVSCNGGSWAREWLIDIGIRHHEILADEPNCSGHNEQFLGVQPETLVGPIIEAYTTAVPDGINSK